MKLSTFLLHQIKQTHNDKKHKELGFVKAVFNTLNANELFLIRKQFEEDIFLTPTVKSLIVFEVNFNLIFKMNDVTKYKIVSVMLTVQRVAPKKSKQSL